MGFHLEMDLFLNALHSLPIAAITNDHKFSALKQHTCIIFYFCSAKIWNGAPWVQIQVLALLSGGSIKTIPFLAFLASRSCPHSLAWDPLSMFWLPCPYLRSLWWHWAQLVIQNFATSTLPDYNFHFTTSCILLCLATEYIHGLQRAEHGHLREPFFCLPPGLMEVSHRISSSLRCPGFWRSGSMLLISEPWCFCI